MGTFANITVMDGSRDRTEEAIERGYQKIDRLIPLLSRFGHRSPVSLLNRDGYLKDAPPELLLVLQASVHYNTTRRELENKSKYSDKNTFGSFLGRGRC